MPEGQVDTISAPVQEATPPSAVTNGTVAGNVETAAGEANVDQGATSTEENFTHVDPKTLDPKLQIIHKQMLADYTRAKQELNARMREYQGIAQKAQIYDQLANDDKFVNYWNTLSQQQQADLKAKAEEPGINITDEEWTQAIGFIPENKERFVGLINKIYDSQTAPLKSKIEEQGKQLAIADATKVIDQFASKNPNFDKYEKYGFISYQMQGMGDISPRQYEAKLAEAYTNADKVWNEIYNLGKQEALGMIRQKQNNSILPPSNSDANIYTGKDPKKLSPAEAVALAKQGKRVPDSW